MLVVRADEVLVEEHADLRLTPASVHKLVVAAAALHHLGPDYRFRSRVEARALEDGSASDVRLIGSGDPTWHEEFYEDDSSRPLRELADQMFEAGVRRVRGDVVVDAGAVRGRPVPVDWGVADATLGYGAAPSALALDRNRTTIRIAPGVEVGRPARILESGGLSWMNRSVTVEAERHGRGTIAFDLEADRAAATLRGEYPISERAIKVDIATPAADGRVGWAFVEAMRARGIAVEGDVRVDQELRDADGESPRRTLAVFESVPLREVLVPLLADSDNFTAEMLLRHVGLQVGGAGRLDTGLDAVRTFLVEVVGWTEDQFELDDGSGLSPFNLLSPRAVVKLLRWSWDQTWRADYFEALASPTQGTVAEFWPSAPPLRAKSGTIRQTQCLAGVLLPGTGNGRVPADGEAMEPVFFAWMINHATRSRSEIRREVMSTLRSWQRTLF